MAKRTAVQHESSPRERIIAAARHLFAERGFHQTAMTDLAAVAQVSVGAIYRSFASKAEIVHAIVQQDTQQLLADLLDRVAQVRQGDVTIGVAIEQVMLKRLADRDDALTHEILAEGHRNPEVADTISVFCNDYLAGLRDVVQLARPGLSGDSLEGAAELLLSCLFGMGHRELTRPALDEAVSARIGARLFLRSLEGEG